MDSPANRESSRSVRILLKVGLYLGVTVLVSMFLTVVGLFWIFYEISHVRTESERAEPSNAELAEQVRERLDAANTGGSLSDLQIMTALRTAAAYTIERRGSRTEVVAEIAVGSRSSQCYAFDLKSSGSVTSAPLEVCPTHDPTLVSARLHRPRYP